MSEQLPFLTMSQEQNRGKLELELLGSPEVWLDGQHVLIWWGWMLIRLGRLDQAEVMLQQCGDLYRQLDLPAIPGFGTDPALPLSLIATIRGDYPLALQYGQQARRESEAHRHQPNLCMAYYALASAAFGQGHYQPARHYAQQAYTLAQQRDDRWFMAYCLNLLGESALALGQVSMAQHQYLLTD
ncbi:MAG: hypothetical protein Fur0044_17560 [Anaerolineae bacterium]|nr:tetratricopeptide repeat protein [Anaerolineales bacterium]MCQ3973894.1 hypothetical protein [Anaerolineae bacterium]